jgi:hypothetical protein
LIRYSKYISLKSLKPVFEVDLEERSKPVAYYTTETERKKPVISVLSIPPSDKTSNNTPATMYVFLYQPTYNIWYVETSKHSSSPSNVRKRKEKKMEGNLGKAG